MRVNNLFSNGVTDFTKNEPSAKKKDILLLIHGNL